MRSAPATAPPPARLDPPQPAAQLFQPARNAHGRRAVAQVTLDLPADRRRSEADEVVPARRVEPVDCVDQPDRADLREIVRLLAAVRVAAGERPHQRKVELDQAFARVGVARLPYTRSRAIDSSRRLA